MDSPVAVFARRRRFSFLRTVLPWTQCPLTSLARAGGCAAKYSAARLETLLAGLVPARPKTFSSVSILPTTRPCTGWTTTGRIVFTVDFFPPLVDDPRTFGAIAAMNALNDVFAMGGRPLLALSVAAFPEELPVEVLGRGARRRGRARARSGRDPRGRAHDSRRRAEVRSRSRRHRAPEAHLAEGGCPSR